MKISFLTVLFLASATGGTLAEETAAQNVMDRNNVRRANTVITISTYDAVAVAPSSGTPCSDGSYTLNGVVATYAGTPDASCVCTTSPFTVKQNIGAPFGQEYYRCAKPEGAACTDDYQCETQVDAPPHYPPKSCTDGTCGNGGQCPNWQGSGGGAYCEFQVPCECTEGDFTVKEQLDTVNGSPCYHCSKPRGASCSSSDDCEQLSLVECLGGFCGGAGGAGACPSRSHNCGTSDCSCPSSTYPIKVNAYEFMNNGQECYRCVKPDGGSCTLDCGQLDCDVECLNQCIDGVCSSGLHDCTPYSGSGAFPQGEFANTDSSNPPCGCGDSSYPNLLVLEYDPNNGNQVGSGGHFAYFCEP